ncbi:MAG: ABC transporter permease [Bacteroidota bacterium]|nr:ABC transporter permease [Bacteroidota bacterium]
MIQYIIRKILYGFLVLFGVLTIVFFLFNVLPGDPARMMLDKREDSVQLQLIQQKYGFDKPLLEQYILYINDISLISIHDNIDEKSFTFLYSGKYNFIRILSVSSKTVVLKFPYLRESFVKSGNTVGSIILKTFPNTFLLAISAIMIALFLGVIFGVIAALFKDSFFDKFILFFSVIGMSLPSFFASIIIAWIFGFLLHSYTGLNMTGSLYEIDDYGRGSFINFRNLILPALTLGIRPIAVIIQLCRNSLLETFTMDYIRTAHAKGLSKFSVVFKHALRNTLNPLVTAISGWFASLLAGSVFVEYVFGWNGIGKEIVDALTKLDLPVVMGSVLFIASLFVIINILVDLIYIWIDPRIKIS